MIKILKQTLVTEFVDTETGETSVDSREFLDDSIVTKKASTTKKRKKNEWDEDPNPIVVREDNKLILNEAAVNLLGITEGERINIKMQVINRRHYPVIGTEEAFGEKGGNLLTKSNTIRYGGKNNDQLAKFGDVFIVTAHPKNEELFILKNKDKEDVEEEEDEVTVSVQEELDELNANLSDEESEIVDELDFEL